MSKILNRVIELIIVRREWIVIYRIGGWRPMLRGESSLWKSVEFRGALQYHLTPDNRFRPEHPVTTT